MLDMAKARMTNDVTAELQVAAEEQRKITQLRLRKLFGIEQ
jgi:2-oxo-4-hydroxy-4-carboxy--5-ureidoimidazoline (OHCU) decarboxylase